jgi:hypothetical protein
MKCKQRNKEEKRLMNKRATIYKVPKDLWKSNKTSISSKNILQGSQFYINGKKEGSKLHLESFLYLCSILLRSRILHNVYFKEEHFGHQHYNYIVYIALKHVILNTMWKRIDILCDIIYLSTAIGLTPGGSTHLHTNST